MYKAIIKTFRVILFEAKSNIELSVEPNSRRIIIFNNDPLSDIEFSVFDEERIFNIFLYYVLGFFAQGIVKNFAVLVHATDSTTT
jgi:hypothetical protein